MSEKFLQRKDAPFGEKVWERIDNTVISTARNQLSARKILHTEGPYGFGMKFLSGPEQNVQEESSKEVSLSASCGTPLITISSQSQNS